MWSTISTCQLISSGDLEPNARDSWRRATCTALDIGIYSHDLHPPSLMLSIFKLPPRPLPLHTEPPNTQWLTSKTVWKQAFGTDARLFLIFFVTTEILTRCMAAMLFLRETAFFTFKGARRLVSMPRYVDSPTGLMNIHKCRQSFVEGKN